MMVLHLLLVCLTTATSLLEPSKTSLLDMQLKLAIMSVVVLDGIVMVYPWNTKSTKPSILKAGIKYWPWESTSTMQSVDLLSLGTAKNGKRSLLV
jgi:hypothetical protein